jgi:MFS family permease
LAVISSILPNHRSDGPRPSIDYLGTLVFTAAVIPLLIGLTEKGLTTASGQTIGWLDWRVGGLLALAAVLGAVFIFVESRVAEPIVPLALFKVRTYAASQVAMFLLSFGFFIGVIFLPRYYQAVRDISATASGYMLWPLLLGLMGTSVLAGLVISRTGRYKLLLVSAMVVSTIGMLLMTQLSATVGDWSLWGWMFVMGVGIGPSMSGYTVVVQNAVPQSEIGVATSNLTFFRQVGGAVGLAVAGTYLASTFTSQLPKNLAKAGVPKALTQHFQAGSESSLTGVGSLAGQLAHVLPPAVQHFIPAIVYAIHQSLAQAIGGSFWLAVVATGLGVLAALYMQEVPLRTSLGPKAPAAPAEVQDEPEPELVAAP